MSCGWPFHHDTTCEECRQWEEKYGENLTQYMDSLAEVRAAARAEQAAKRRTMRATGSASEQQG